MSGARHAVLIALTLLSSAGPLPAGDGSRPSVPADRPAVKVATSVHQIRRRLAEITQFDFQTPRDQDVSFEQCFAFLGARYGLRFRFNVQAFAEEQITDFSSLPVHPELVPRARLSLDTILRRLLSQIPATSGANFIVRDRWIEITTNDVLAQQREQPQLPPEYRTSPLYHEYRQALRRRVVFRGFSDPKTTLRGALDSLAHTHGVVIDVNGGAFRAVMINDVESLPICETPIPAPKQRVPLSTVLDTILARLPVPGDAAFVVRHDRVEITTKEQLLRENGKETLPGFDPGPLK